MKPQKNEPIKAIEDYAAKKNFDKRVQISDDDSATVIVFGYSKHRMNHLVKFHKKDNRIEPLKVNGNISFIEFVKICKDDLKKESVEEIKVPNASDDGNQETKQTEKVEPEKK